MTKSILWKGKTKIMDTEHKYKKELNWGILSTYRSELMCISIIGILCCHLLTNEAVHGIDHSLLSQLFMYGNCFVDAFMFLSGLGLYYSFSKNSDIKVFYKKRFFKIIPAYIAIALSALIIYNIINSGSAAAVFYDFFFVSFFMTGETFAWFVLAILILYILFPLFYNIIYRNKSLNYHLIASIILVCIFVCLAVMLMYITPVFFENVDIALERFPAFIIGIYFGSLCKDKRSINVFEILSVIILFIAGMFLRQKSIISSYYTCSLIGVSAIMIFAFLLYYVQLLFKDAVVKPMYVLNTWGGVYVRNLSVSLCDAVII